MLVLAVAVIAAATATARLPPAPPPQTAAQTAYMVRVSAKAKVASAAARPAVLRALGDPTLVAGLAACCPGLAGKAPAELLDWVHRQAEVSEVRPLPPASRLPLPASCLLPPTPAHGPLPCPNTPIRHTRQLGVPRMPASYAPRTCARARATHSTAQSHATRPSLLLRA